MLDLIDEIEATAGAGGHRQGHGDRLRDARLLAAAVVLPRLSEGRLLRPIVDTEEAMIVANVNQEAELAPTIAGRYDRVGASTTSDPAWTSSLYVRTDIPKE